MAGSFKRMKLPNALSFNLTSRNSRQDYLSKYETKFTMLKCWIVQISLPHNFCQGNIEMHICKVDSQDQPYFAMVEPHVFVVFDNPTGGLLHSEPKISRTWMTKEGTNPNPHKCIPKQLCPICSKLP